MRTVHVLLFLLAATGFWACKDSVVKEGEDKALTTDAYLIFGSFYGECVGPSCIVFYKLQDGKLYENTNHKYPAQNQPFEGDYQLASNEKYQIVKDLADEIPAQLYDETETYIGCPDCADGGGLYIEVSSSAGKRFWYIDNNDRYTPEYLHDFVAEANRKINLLR